ncbi:kaempferol 3-O-beta-D-galactosyltransferase-like [Humulus lupulus]|uniref:kaempferol 3-O-beta-D-galactosyltransferase-like n=1 Tax=Humulus lupulus TaxID=3486 RepID=UPI002B40DA4D|nr:kaempferol 3-O-beta-D-galactosyltransferase-like [Humulus lupulus]
MWGHPTWCCHQSLAADEGGCLPWLDKQEPRLVAHINFGSVVAPTKEELTAIAEAFERSGVPFIWTLEDNMIPNLPKGFLEKSEKFWENSTMGTQAEILLIDECKDMVEEIWEIGVKVGSGVLTKEALERCLDMVLLCKKKRRMKEKLKLLKELAAEAVGPGGISTQDFKELLDLIVARLVVLKNIIARPKMLKKTSLMTCEREHYVPMFCTM